MEGCSCSWLNKMVPNQCSQQVQDHLLQPLLQGQTHDQWMMQTDQGGDLFPDAQFCKAMKSILSGILLTGKDGQQTRSTRWRQCLPPGPHQPLSPLVHPTGLTWGLSPPRPCPRSHISAQPTLPSGSSWFLLLLVMQVCVCMLSHWVSGSVLGLVLPWGRKT